MTLIEITDFHASNLWEYSFDQVVDTFKPLNSPDEKKHIQVYKYPLIFRILPLAMLDDYSNLSKSSIQLYATRLGFSIMDHDDRTKKLKEVYRGIIKETNPENILSVDSLFNKIGYPYATPMSDNGKIYLSVQDKIQDYLSEHGDCFGLPEYQMGVILFLMGVQSATLSKYNRELVDLEINRFWDSIDRRIRALNKHLV